MTSSYPTWAVILVIIIAVVGLGAVGGYAAYQFYRAAPNSSSNGSSTLASVQGTISLQSISNCSDGCYQVSADFCNSQCSPYSGNTYATVTTVSNYTFHYSVLLYSGTYYPEIGYVWYNSYHQQFIEHCFATVFVVKPGTLNLNQDISC